MKRILSIYCMAAVILLGLPFILQAATPVKSMVVFGDSLSDVGNTTHLLKVLRQDESPAYLVQPLKAFVINRMVEFAEEYYIPQVVLDAGIETVTDFFDHQLAPMLTELTGKIKLIPILPGKPYWQSRFSNGPVWNEYLARMLHINQVDESAYVNKAFSGAWTTTYDHQLSAWNLIRHPILTLKALVVGKLIPPSLGLVVQAYLMEHDRLDGQAVYFLFSGGNDFLNVLRFEDNYNSVYLNDYINNVLSSLHSAITKLNRAGARHLVVFSVPQVGKTPLYVHRAESSFLDRAVEQYNQRLEAMIKQVRESHPKLDILFIDSQAMMRQVALNNGVHVFTNIQDACIDVKLPMFAPARKTPFSNNQVLDYAARLQENREQWGPAAANYHVCDNPEDYLFWDEIHPTTLAHQLLAWEVCQIMHAHGYQTDCQLPT